MAANLIPIVPLTKAGFAPFGDVIEIEDARPVAINQGFAARFDDLANVDVASEGGAVNISIFAATARPRPIVIKLMERHPLGSQAFFPLQERPWLVLVCSDPEVAASYRAFSASGRQGVNYTRQVWHHPLLVLENDSRFLVVERKGPGHNLDEHWLKETQWLHLSPA
jgi:ureidoglycolate lyase